MPESTRHFEELVEALFDGVYFMDREQRITYWNASASQIMGYDAAEMIGTRCRDHDLVHLNAAGHLICDSEECPAVRTMRTGKLEEAALYVRHREGHRLPVLLRSIPQRDAEGRLTGVMMVVKDTSPLVQARAELDELRGLALLDPLTQIGNRRYLEMHVRSRLDEMERYGWRFGLVFCDIDEFKQINDRFGHQVGDQTIRMVARTLTSCIRPFDVVGRWGGDEFMALVTQVREGQLPTVAERLRALINESRLRVDSADVAVTVSTGATVARPGDTEGALFERVDSLLYRSKAAGRNQVSIDIDQPARPG